MPIHDDWGSDDEEAWKGYDDDDDNDEYDPDEETTVVPCPSCRRNVYEDAEQCPHCGEYIVHRLSAWRNRPGWWVLGGLLGIVAVIWLLIRSSLP